MFRKVHPSVGARPGTLMITPDALPSRIRAVCYGPDAVREDVCDDLSRLEEWLAEAPVAWIDIQGLGNEPLLRKLAESLSIHPLAMEDVVNVPQRPKVELSGDHLLVIFRTVRFAGAPSGAPLSQISLFMTDRYVLTFQEGYDDALEPVRSRIHCENARLRQHGTDYLAYAILDTIVDGYYPALEKLGDKIERIEQRMIERPHPTQLKQVNSLRNELLEIRRAIWPQREVVHSLLTDSTSLISDQVRIFVRDTYDHCLQMSEVVDAYRDTVSGLVNTYLSSVGHRTNEVMKTLTVLSSVFVPLTFVAGIYGMNFDMPELKWRWSYPAVWTLMLAIVAGMLWYFHRLGWLGGEPGETLGLNQPHNKTDVPVRDATLQPAAPIQAAVFDHDRRVPRPDRTRRVA